MNNPQPKKPKSKLSKVISKLVGGLLFGVVGLLVVFQFVGIMSAAKNNGVPNYGGFQSFRVVTNSMEPTYKVDTMVFIRKIDVKKLNEDDVITFLRTDATAYNDGRGDNLVITHRITDIEIIDGEYYFRTLGDNLFATTCPRTGCTAVNRDYVKSSDIFGVVIGQSMVLGKTNKLLVENPAYIILFVMVPLVVVFSSSLIDLFRQIKARNAEEAASGGESITNESFEALKEQEKLKMMIELEKERMRKELEDGGKHDE